MKTHTNSEVLEYEILDLHQQRLLIKQVIFNAYCIPTGNIENNINIIIGFIY